ncbi:MAG: FliO/MopB family protein [Nocardioidaceae bacterium]
MVELVLRVVLSLAVVLGLLWFIARMSARRMGGGRGSVLNVVGRQSLGRTASMAVVTVGARVLVVGVSENGVRLLTELDPEEIELDATEVLEGAEVAPVTAQVSAQVSAPVVPLPVGTRPGRHAPEPRPRRPVLAANGSVLSAQTWRQAWVAVTGRSGRA